MYFKSGIVEFVPVSSVMTFMRKPIFMIRKILALIGKWECNQSAKWTTKVILGRIPEGDVMKLVPRKDLKLIASWQVGF